MIDKLIAFYEAEKKLLNKTNSHMKGIYRNRVDANLKWDRELIIFIVDKCWEVYFSNKFDKNYLEKLTFGFNLIAWKKEITESVLNHLEFRKSNLK